MLVSRGWRDRRLMRTRCLVCCQGLLALKAFGLIRTPWTSQTMGSSRHLVSPLTRITKKSDLAFTHGVGRHGDVVDGVFGFFLILISSWHSRNYRREPRAQHSQDCLKC